MTGPFFHICTDPEVVLCAADSMFPKIAKLQCLEKSSCLLITLAETDTMLHVCVQEVFQMESMVVYLGSDHVIKTPDFDFRKNSLRVSTTLEDAKQQAHKKVGIGVVSAYQLNLEHLVSIEDGQSVLDGFENVDVIQHTCQDECSLSLCSERALRSLSFLEATFTN